MNFKIKKVAVLGAGVMGAQIACHFANIGIEVLLLDIAPKELNENEKKQGLDLNHPQVKNRITSELFNRTLKLKPDPLYKKEFAKRVNIGNFDDDLPKIKSCDWVIEVVVENLEIKKSLYEKIELYRKENTLITTNTSGIPIQILTQGRSDNFKQHFCGTHFFNPPRYLKLLEIIPAKETSKELIDFLTHFGERFLGKSVVSCKDTPAFIANRVGIYSMMSVVHLMEEMDFSVQEIDKLTGIIIGRPKSATFRTCDVVGLDTLVFVAQNLQQVLVNDEGKDTFLIPDSIQKMLELQWLGSKTKQGFYKKVKSENGESEILSLNLNSFGYQPMLKLKIAEFEKAKALPNLTDRIKSLIKGDSKINLFYQKLFFGLFAYISHRIPEITDDLYKIDEAMCAGFAWEIGPFEIWNSLGFEKTIPQMEKLGIKPAAWIYEMVDKKESFYQLKNGQNQYYDIKTNQHITIPGSEQFISLKNIRSSQTLWKNEGCSIINLGDGIINLEFHSKMNTIGSEIIQGINKAIEITETDHQALIISNEGDHFSAGANIGLVFMLAIEQEFEELDMVVKTFQNTMLKLKYAPFPVIAAPHNMTLGGGCEVSMHCDKVIAHAETYMGLVELGVGVIPAGGGSKEFALRLSNEIKTDDVRINRFRDKFLTIGQAKVSTSAWEAFDLGYLRKDVDEIVVSRKHQLKYAKQAALLMIEKGYTPPIPPKDITVLGNEGLSLVYSGADGMQVGNYISEYDKHLSIELGKILSGGELNEPTLVSENYLLNLERKTFVKLCQEKKTLERMQSLLQKGKILRN
ncbi:3-hydroxyacyl-CoA dehydrogenase/enoyl-CoA hydratase family protein [Ancylomarina euxinus]|uniref:3-hydroxyacyl-CoA dehydrogenase/enoyl-CoA hydratase family protein n=1 Tax=Ancylomarina euxinus TaxID=2283627 RepID=A0A425Y5B2_9BACT|nr:3-hydroxyacyl-CoA dehydrogenase/enoyl-CoA hydratase family protein [Ancylomarina euxinus]MCZ4694281.1 3-hydroxyacyl-CoA dehydrogenase/enoyl-CoA hydratase family protein [Ancylomarina euxinus]MUP14388.1 3-hydroxyacyl-CoA dehydrogenase [Ancylomarina euxinus]RRG23698.1 3-hydroxyacyl-CoA dehydrogenase/enoyl-CoA hydratase family protein [Ancylomarina euxinus]